MPTKLPTELPTKPSTEVPAEMLTRMPRASRVTRLLATTGLAGMLLLGGAGSAAADGEQEPPAEAPTEAGTTFRTATALDDFDEATAPATIGEYLYWVFPVAAGQDATATATVTFQDDGARSAPATWQLDVYDGLRRRQACVAGEATVQALVQVDTVSLSCTLRTVRPWAETWANAPLPGAYYLRLTAVDLPEEDLGLPVEVRIQATTEDAGGAHAHGGDLGEPLVLTSRAGSLDTGDGQAESEDSPEESDEVERVAIAVVSEPDGGWSGGWWSDRWLWTAGGGVLGALAAIGGYSLIRRPHPRG